MIYLIYQLINFVDSFKWISVLEASEIQSAGFPPEHIQSFVVNCFGLSPTDSYCTSSLLYKCFLTVTLWFSSKRFKKHSGSKSKSDSLFSRSLVYVLGDGFSRWGVMMEWHVSASYPPSFPLMETFLKDKIL